MKKVFFMLLLLLFVQGCTRGSKQPLDVPSNIRFEDEMVIWDAVDGADRYSILVNNISYSVTDNQFSMYDFPNGTYNVRVRSHKGDEQTIYTNTFTFTINRAFEHPKNVYISGSTLYWDHTAEANSYLVYINDEVYEVLSGRTFNLSVLPLNTLYFVRVVAVYDQGNSNESLTVIYQTYVDIVGTIEVSANKNRATNVLIPVEESYDFDYVYKDRKLYDNSVFSFYNGIFIIDYQLLQPLNEGLHVFYLLTEEGRVEIMLNVLDERKPYMTSENTVIYTGEDLSFEFELFGGSFGNLSGLDITGEDYSFDQANARLTISKEFIERIRLDDPERNTIILSYDLSSEETSVIGFIFIYLNE